MAPEVRAEHLPRLSRKILSRRCQMRRAGKVAARAYGLAIVKHIVNRHRGRLSIRKRNW